MTLRRVTSQAAVRLAPNPGPMTLDGTNSYVLRAGDGPAVVVDPGPNDAAHLAALAADAPIVLILITHHHHDHTDGAPALHRLTGSPVRAPSPDNCVGGPVLVDGERITVGDLDIRVIATPGHTADSVCFHLPDDGASGSVLTGDSVLGRGSTVIGIPDGTLAQYLDSLSRLIDLAHRPVEPVIGLPVHESRAEPVIGLPVHESRAEPVIGLPAHGESLPDLAEACQRYLDHRLARLAEVRAALGRLGLAPDPSNDDTVAAVLAEVYGDVDPGVVFAAAYSVATQLAYLADPPPPTRPRRPASAN